MQQALPELALRLQAPVRLRTESSQKYRGTIRRRETLLERIQRRLGISNARTPVRGILLCRDRSRNNLQCNASDKQAGNLPPVVPEYYQRRDTTSGSDD